MTPFSRVWLPLERALSHFWSHHHLESAACGSTAVCRAPGQRVFKRRVWHPLHSALEKSGRKEVVCRVRRQAISDRKQASNWIICISYGPLLHQVTGPKTKFQNWQVASRSIPPRDFRIVFRLDEAPSWTKSQRTQCHKSKA